MADAAALVSETLRQAISGYRTTHLIVATRFGLADPQHLWSEPEHPVPNTQPQLLTKPGMSPT
jgi:hypothetical protein